MNVEKRLSSEERKSSILAAALPLFAAKGIDGTTTKQIAQAAKVSEALLYKHFPSKESIYEQIQDFMCAHSNQAGLELSKLPKNSNSLIHVVYATLYLIFIGAECKEEKDTTTRLLLFSLLEDGQLVRTFTKNRFEIWVPEIVKLLEASKKAGDLIEDETPLELKVWMIHHFGVGFLHLNIQNIVDYKMEAKDVLSNMTKFALRGIGLKEEVLETFYNPEALYLFAVGMINKISKE